MARGVRHVRSGPAARRSDADDALVSRTPHAPAGVPARIRAGEWRSGATVWIMVIACGAAASLLAWGTSQADDLNSTPAAPAFIQSARPLAPMASDLAPHRAAIASAHPLASAAGREILDAGGNAFDAAVAVSAALAVVEGTSSGLGGGGFYLLRHADGSVIMLDARETAPGAATRDMYLDSGGQPIPGASTDGALAAAIPGEPAAFELLARKYGKLSLKTSLAPAIRLAREGFPVYARLQGGIRIKRPALLRSPAAARVFLTADGEVPSIGTLIKQPDLADTLEVLAEHGARGFYHGRIAQKLVDGVRAAGGIWTLADLASYRVIERKPLVGEYRGARIVAVAPPSSGGVAILDSLNILSGYDLPAFDTATRKHLIIESLRRAFRDRAVYLGDPDFVRIPVALLINPAYAAGQRASIRTDKAMPSDLLPGVNSAAAGMNTTHFSILDAAGNAVAATISVNLWLGSGFMPDNTGVLLNDTMDDFSVKPDAPNAFGLVGGAANAIAPGKRPLSSMSPSFVQTRKGLMITGSPGGSTIISMVLLSILNYVDGMSATDIVKYPRYHEQFQPDVVHYEADAFTAQEIAELESKGQALKEAERRWGNMQVVTWDFAGGAVDAASDPRGEGEGLVY